MPTLFASSHYGSSQFDSGLFRPESAPSLFAFPLARLINGSAMRTVKQNDSYILKVFMADAADRLSGLDGLTLAVTISKPGADFVAISPTQVDRGYGWYDVTLTTAHLDTVGDNVVRATASGADVSETVIQVRPKVLGDDVTVEDGDITAIAQATRAEVDSNSTQLTSIINYVSPGIASILEDTGTTIPAQISALSIPTANQIADALLIRDVDNVEASAPEHSLTTVILACLEMSISGSTMTIKRTDGSTTHVTKTLTTSNSATPITGIT